MVLAEITAKIHLELAHLLCGKTNHSNTPPPSENHQKKPT